MRGLKEEQMQKFLQSNIGRKISVLIEKNGLGRADNFAPVEIDRSGLAEGELQKVVKAGAMIDVEISAISGENLVGRPIASQNYHGYGKKIAL